MELFRKCPSCGRRFAVKLRKEELVSEEIAESDRVVTTPAGLGRVTRGGVGMETDTAIQTTVHTSVERDTIRFEYECGKCGHKWEETRIESRKLHSPNKTKSDNLNKEYQTD